MRKVIEIQTINVKNNTKESTFTALGVPENIEVAEPAGKPTAVKPKEGEQDAKVHVHKSKKR